MFAQKAAAALAAAMLTTAAALAQSPQAAVTPTPVETFFSDAGSAAATPAA